MRLRNIQLSNWACHEQLSVDFSGGLRIEGRNGTGKTSILEAIRFGFAGDARGFKNRIKNGARESKVELSFEKDGQEYVVDKRLFVDKPSTAELRAGDTQVADNPSSVSSHLSGILSEDVLEGLLYVPQGELTAIVDHLTRKGGRQELDALFGLDRLERVYKAAGERLREAEAQREVYDRQLAAYGEDPLSGFGREEREANDVLFKVNSSINECRGRLGELEPRLKGVVDEITSAEKTIKEREQVQQELGKLEVALAEARKESSELERRLGEFEAKRSEVSGLENAVRGLDHYPIVRGLLQERNGLIERLSGYEGLVGEGERLKALADEVAAKSELSNEVDKLRGALRRLERETAAVEEGLRRQQEYLSSLEGLEGEVKCPRCGQKLTEAHLMHERQVTGRAVKKLTTKHSNMAAKTKGFADELAGMEAELKALEEKEVEVKHLGRELKEKLKEKQRIEEQQSALVLKLSEAGYRDESLGDVESRVRELDNMRGRIELLRKELAGEPELREKLSSTKALVDGFVAQERRLRERLDSLFFDEERLATLRGEKDSLTEERFRLEGDVRQAEQQVREVEAALKDVQERKDAFLKLKGDRDGVERKGRLLARARDVFHTDRGLPKFLRDRSIRRLNELLTYYFKRFNENPAYQRIFFDQDYRIQVKAVHGVLDLQQLSGGERVQLAIALRIALIELLSPVRLLILDEPFGSLDRAHRELLGEALNKMGAGWQVILVTHIHVESLQLPSFELAGY